MRFFKAIPLANKPFIQWDGWAKNIDELIALGESDNPLILPFELVPDYVFGVSPIKIVDGELVDRTEEEMAVFETEFEVSVTTNTNRSKILDINDATFFYIADEFPMHEAARLRYMAVAMDSPSDAKFMKVDGSIVTILEANVPTFLEKFYKEIQSITNV